MDGNTTGEMVRKRDETGQYTENYPLSTVAEAVGEIEEATTQDVADELDCAYQTAYMKLRQLEDEGTVQSRRIGNVRLWFRGGGE